jgi:1-acyl-sn-glycerol-3-phosphate acyltransferase
MIAEKSWHLPVIGALARIMGCIPVVRPQDSVVKGLGLVRMADDQGVSRALPRMESPRRRHLCCWARARASPGR